MQFATILVAAIVYWREQHLPAKLAAVADKLWMNELSNDPTNEPTNIWRSAFDIH